MAEEPTPQGESREENQIPKHRFDEVNQAKKDAEKRAADLEKRLNALEDEKRQADEERETEQGKFKDLAEKRKAEMDKKDERIKELERDSVRKDQLSAFRKAASGVVRSDALDDAFSMLSGEELDKVDATDEDRMKQMASQLTEARPYLADTARGSGSGGSETPVPQANGDGHKQPLPWGNFNKRRIS